MKYIYLTILTIVISTSVNGAFEQNEAGARASPLGGAFVGLADNSWAIFYNPAGLARLTHNELSVFYLPQQFGLRELSTTAMTCNYNSKIGAVGFGLRSFGFNLYKEITGTLCYANEFAGADLGVSINYYSLTISSYGNDAAVGVDVGLLLPLSRNLNFGLFARNLNMPAIGKAKEKLLQIFYTGISYSPAENFIFVADYRKEISFAGSFRFGVEYKVFDIASLCIGAANGPPSYLAGIGVE
jgi:hypothetical protein